MGGWPEPRAPRRSGPRSSSFGWCSQPSLLSRRKSLLWPAGHASRPAYPSRPLLLHHLPLQALLYSLFLKQPVGLPPCSGLFHTHLCCWALHSPCRSQFESFCFLHRRPPPHPGLPALLRFNCVPPCCHFEAHTAVTVIRRSNGWIVGLSGLFHAFFPCTPNFQLSAGRGRVNLVCPQPPIGPGRQSQELWAEATQDDFPEANRSSFPRLPPHLKPEPSRGGPGGWGGVGAGLLFRERGAN